MIEFPSRAAFGKKITLIQLRKEGLPNRLAGLVKSLVWAFKLSPSTVQLAATESVKEIEVMDLTLKESCSNLRMLAAVIAALDRLIPNPLIFRVYNEDGTPREVAFNLKTSGGAMAGTSDVFRLFRTTDEMALPTGVVNLESFYKNFAASVGGLSAAPNESVRDLEERHYNVESLRCDLHKVEWKLMKETQFDRKYELSKEKQRLTKEIEKCLNSKK